MSVTTAKTGSIRRIVGQSVQMFASWLATGFVTGLAAFAVSLGLMFVVGTRNGYRLALVAVTTLTVAISDHAIRAYVAERDGQQMTRSSAAAAAWARSLFLPFISGGQRQLVVDETASWWRRTQVHLTSWVARTFSGPATFDTLVPRLAALAVYTGATAFSGAIIVQGTMNEQFGFRPRRWMTVWGAAVFGVKFAIIYGSAALAIRDGGEFWSNLQGAFSL